MPHSADDQPTQTIRCESTVAQLLFTVPLPIHFARLVSDLQQMLSRFQDLPLRLNWDCGDIAIFDMPGTRILLGWSDAPTRGVTTCLTLSVGPSPHPNDGFSPPPAYDLVCSRIVERLQQRCKPAALLWHQISGVFDSDALDMLMDTMAPFKVAPPEPPKIDADAIFLKLPPDMRAPRHIPSAAPARPNITPLSAATLKVRKIAPKRAANDSPDLPRTRYGELSAVHAALYPVITAPPGASMQLRLAAHAMNATLMVVCLPVGAAMMTYSVLRGGDLRLSARFMVATGVITAMASSQFGQQVASFAGV